MQKSIPKLFSSYALAVSAAVFNTGCTTPIVQNSFGDDCMVSSKARTNLLFVFAVQSDSGDSFSKSCSEGRLAAATTLIGSPSQGQLHPVGALFALEFKNIITENLITEDESIKKHWREVDFYFDFFLKKKSGMDIKQIARYVDKLKESATQREQAEREASRQAELTAKAAEEDRLRREESIRKRCTRVGGIISCSDGNASSPKL